MRLYILEGPDGGGKTTLMGRLAQWLTDRGRRVTVQHHGPYLGERKIGWHYFSSMKHALIGKADVILDRSWLSEPIYATAYRDGFSRLDPGELQQLNRAAYTCGAIVIHCIPQRQTMVDNWLKRKAEGGEYVTDASAFNKVIDLYMDTSSLWPLETVAYDYETMTFADLVERLKDAEEMNPLAPYPYAGNIVGRVGIVGDKANHRWFPLPFFSMLETGCSIWLAREMAKAGISERDLLWVNAYDVDGRHNDPTPFVKAGMGTKSNPVFALGKNAVTWCLEHRLEHIEHKHPMYWKRFNYKLKYPLIKDIINSIEGEKQ